jgi:hypothetical protein
VDLVGHELVQRIELFEVRQIVELHDAHPLPHTRQRRVRPDLEQPAPERRAPLELIQVAQHREIRVLHRVLDVRARLQDGADDPKEALIVPPHQRFARAHVARTGKIDQDILCAISVVE